jgi:hypothetical protein
MRHECANGPAGHVYLIRHLDSGLFKIGLSESPQRRFTQINAEHGGRCELVHAIPTDLPRRLERELHARYAGHRVAGEWFHLPPACVREVRAISEMCYDEFEPALKARNSRRGVYVVIPREYAEALRALTKGNDHHLMDRSLSFMVKLAVRGFLASKSAPAGDNP